MKKEGATVSKMKVNTSFRLGITIFFILSMISVSAAQKSPVSDADKRNAADVPEVAASPERRVDQRAEQILGEMRDLEESGDADREMKMLNIVKREEA
jgi:hypothetical protein